VSRSGDVEPGPSQGGSDPGQRQPDEAGRIDRLDPVEQGNAQRFCLEAASAIEWLVPFDVSVDLSEREVAEAHMRLVDVRLLGAGRAIDDVHGREERHRLAGGSPQLFTAGLDRAGFAQYFGVPQCHLVGPDHDSPGMALEDRKSLAPGQARGEINRGFTGP